MSQLPAPARELSRIAGETTFAASDAPLLLLDRSLVIRGVNPAYSDATMWQADDLRGQFMFDAFPDNPDDPAADGVAKLSASLERVLRTGRRDRMSPQRYDVKNPRRDGQFVRKVWLPVNTPIVEDDRVVGVLHHVEDVTGTPSLHGRREPGGLPRHPQPSSEGAGAQELEAADDAAVDAALCDALHEIENLETALASSRDIGTAIGIVMWSYKIDQASAWDLLRKRSQRTNVKVRDLATHLIETGTLDL